MKDELFKIGDVADIFELSVQTLRFYEKMGLFVPAVKKESSGYRYYSLEQFERLRQVLFLRDFGLSLKDIKHQLDVQDSAEYKILLENCSKNLERKIQSDTKLKQYIDLKTESMKLAADLPHNKTLFLPFSKRTILKYDCSISCLPGLNGLSGFEKIEHTIIELITKYKLKASIDSVGQLFSSESLSRSNVDLVTTGLFVTEEVFTDDTYLTAHDNITNIPEGVYGVMYYKSATIHSLPYIRKLLDDIKRHSFIPYGDIIRTIIFDLGRDNDSMDGYIACIRVLVKEKTSDT